MSAGTTTRSTNVGPMNPNDVNALLNAANRNGGAVVPMPSQAQRDEVARVQGMQVRTNAVTLAVQLLANQDDGLMKLINTAKSIEEYILGA